MSSVDTDDIRVSTLSIVNTPWVLSVGTAGTTFDLPDTLKHHLWYLRTMITDYHTYTVKILNTNIQKINKIPRSLILNKYGGRFWIFGTRPVRAYAQVKRDRMTGLGHYYGVKQNVVLRWVTPGSLVSLTNFIALPVLVIFGFYNIL